MRRAFTLFALTIGLLGAIPAAQAEDTLYVPIFGYRTGPFAASGIPFVNGIRDYLTMLNVRDGGIGAVKLVIEECETGYDTKKGIECYEAVKARNPVVLTPLSTGIGLAVLPRLAVDKVPMLTMAYGLTASAMGDVFPWAFNPPDTYWDTAGAMLQYIANSEGGLDKLSGKTIGYIYLDAPYGKEAIPLLEQLSKTYGYTLKLYPVAATEMQNQSSQWLSVRRDKPDWMMMFGWGALHPTALKEAAKVNYPMDHFISNFWVSDHDMRAGGEGSKGFHEVAFHAAGTAFPAFKDIQTLVLDKAATDTPKGQPGEVLYNHGVYNAMLIAEAITNAQRLAGHKMVTGEDVRRGFEAIDLSAARLKAIGLEGFTDPLKLSCSDHNGHGRISVQMWDGTQWTRVTDPAPPMVSVTQPLVEAAAKDYVEKNTGWPKRVEGCDKIFLMDRVAPHVPERGGIQVPPILEVSNIEVVYDHVILVLKGVSLTVPAGGIVALLGANGAGKTTTLKAISNLLKAERGDVTKGVIHFRGERIDNLSPSELVRRGCIQVMEGRGCFPHLSVEENLLTGAFTRRDGRAAIRDDLARIYERFPRLMDRRNALAGYTSGGEQQMCVIGRAMMARPSMILLDEPSMGLAPRVVEEIFDIVRVLNERDGVSFLLAEQNTNLALQYATYGYILETGRLVMDGAAAALRENADVREFYLGMSAGDRKSFRNVKSYKRRKRWLA